MDAKGICYDYGKGLNRADCINWQGVDGKCIFRGHPGKLVSRMKRCPIEYTNARILKGVSSKHGKSTTPKSGKVTNGNDAKPCSCGTTLRVAVVTVAVRFPIIPTLRCTASPSTLIYPIQDPTATSVIQVSIPESSGVQYAEKLFQNPRVSDALVALRIAISSVLDPIGSNETNPVTGKIDDDTVKRYKCTATDHCTLHYAITEPSPQECGMCGFLRENE